MEKAALMSVAMDWQSAAKERAGKLETWVAAHARMVFRICYLRLRHHQDAEDATQETFLKAWKSTGLDSGIEDPQAWLARIAWRVSGDRAAARGKLDARRTEDAGDTLESLQDLRPGAEDQAVAGQLREYLQSAILSLPADLREPLLLASTEELTSGQIAVVLGIPEGTVRTRVMRARELLRKKCAGVLGVLHG